MTPQGPAHDRWMVSYADMMTLLCAILTTVYAATPPAAVTAQAPPAAPVEAAAPVAADDAPPPDDTAAVRGQLLAALAADLESARVRLVDDPRGLVIEVPEAAAFGVGEAELSPAATAMMQRISAVVAPLPLSLRIEGHTDDTPMATPRFQSNWDLSAARAVRVVDLFVRAGVDPARLSAAGYGQFHPRAGNATAEGRRRNRRVDIVLLNRTATGDEPLTGALR